MPDNMQSTRPVDPGTEKGAAVFAILAALILAFLTFMHFMLFNAYGEQLVGAGIPVCTILILLGLLLTILGLLLRARHALLPIAFALLALSRLIHPQGSVVLAYEFLYMYPESRVFRAVFGLGAVSIWLPLILDILAFAGMALLTAGLSPKSLPKHEKTLRACCWIPCVLVLAASGLISMILQPVNGRGSIAVERALTAELPLAAALLFAGLWVGSVCRRSAVPAVPTYVPYGAPGYAQPQAQPYAPSQAPGYAQPQAQPYAPPQAPGYAQPQTQPCAPVQAAVSAAPPVEPPALPPELEEKRKAYAEMLAAGIFTQEEYERKCAALFKEET